MASGPVARSPIPAVEPRMIRDGWEVSIRVAKGSVRIADATPLAKVRIAGETATVEAAAGVRPGTARRDSRGWLVSSLAPGEAMLFASCGAGNAIVTEVCRLASGGFAAVMDLTDARALLALEGDLVPVLAKLCPLDIGSRSPWTCFRTSVAGVVTEMVKTSASDGVLLLHCDRSYAQHLYSALLQAGAGSDMEVAGSWTSLALVPESRYDT